MYWLLLFTIGFLVWLILGRGFFYDSTRQMFIDTIAFYIFLLFLSGCCIFVIAIGFLSDSLDSLDSLIESFSKYEIKPLKSLLHNCITLLIIFILQFFF